MDQIGRVSQVSTTLNGNPKTLGRGKGVRSWKRCQVLKRELRFLVIGKIYG